ncbi:hypothetical protein COX59_01460 [Candidatus Beckwithbacteria bacterium CG_4_10_14_0_2_um_filter_47_25]|uniref:Sodium/calcium exchanger membrane region domain-containing protein n=1 Tax=Candidatus Beckwithbacteria bacterium CG_4_10_14_0_2_um_filter_47_25 TaxID=1974493 RepID=A0A2M7W6U4_9BACT|nr:MAG: hypothetical protein COX59_01460 [Candidatus Beckwithbacteria bacterium CG_4_10_14_0_2_um_filter_47_25]
MTVFYLIGLIFFCWLLIKATSIVTGSLERLSRLLHLGQFAITSLLLAFATSIPELVVGVTAALEGRPSLSLGVVLGSNIANLSLVVGAAAILGGTLSVAGQWAKMDIFSVFLSGALPLILLMDGVLGRSDGLILLLVYVMYNYGVLKQKPADLSRPAGRFKLTILDHSGLPTTRTDKLLAWLFFGVALLIFSADMIVKIAVSLAQNLNVPVLVVGMFLIAIGATLPELSIEARAIRQHKAGIVLGNLTGSIVVNSTLILSIVSLIAPIRLGAGKESYLLAAAVFGLMFLLFWYFVRSKMKLERWEGLILVVAYFIFAILEWNK